MKRVSKAIILAAGRSTRYGKNKLVDPILGKSTVEYCIEFCIENGMNNYIWFVNICKTLKYSAVSTIVGVHEKYC